LVCDFIYKPLVVDENGDPVLDGAGKPQYVEADYPDGATVSLTIDAKTPVTSNATITGSKASVLVDHAQVDPVFSGAWRLVLTTQDGVDQVLANGTVARRDGT